MGLDVYNMVKDIIGPVPLELEFLYGVGTFIAFLIPFLMVYGVWNIVFGRK